MAAWRGQYAGSCVASVGHPRLPRGFVVPCCRDTPDARARRTRNTLSCGRRLDGEWLSAVRADDRGPPRTDLLVAVEHGGEAGLLDRLAKRGAQHTVERVKGGHELGVHGWSGQVDVCAVHQSRAVVV